MISFFTGAFNNPVRINVCSRKALAPGTNSNTSSRTDNIIVKKCFFRKCNANNLFLLISRYITIKGDALPVGTGGLQRSSAIAENS